MDQSGPNFTQMGQNDRIGQKWTEIDSIGPYCTELTKVDQMDWNKPIGTKLDKNGVNGSK